MGLIRAVRGMRREFGAESKSFIFQIAEKLTTDQSRLP